MINMPGGPEVMVILVIALLVLGPQQLPKAMRTLGSVMGEIRKVSTSFQAEMRQAMDSVVDLSPDEKPQSGTMATPRAALDEGPVETSATEVVASNGAAAPDADVEVAAEGSGSTAGSPSASSSDAPGSLIDPADRAAG